MEKIELTVEVPKELYELFHNVGGFAVAVKVALEDGWQLEQDVPILLTEALAKLVPAVQGIDKIDDEFSEDKGAALAAAVNGLQPHLEKLLKK